MVQKSGGPVKFWRELKRRKVINVITVYASGAFAIIEIINNLATPLHLPGSVATIALIVLAAGFPFAIILSWIYDLTGGTLVRTRDMDEIRTEEKTKAPNAWKIATYISFIVIIGLVVLNISRGSSIIKPGTIQSLVILPFDNYTGDEKLDYFVSGMHSSLIADVGKIGSLHVISKTTSDVYKNAHKSLPQIASELNADAVVEAQVMCIGDTICVQVRLISADRKEKQLWAGNYREDNRKILSLYNQVTKQIADEVRVKLSLEEEQLLSRSMIVNREAYDAYMKGEFYWRKLTQNDLDTAMKYFELAKEKDPGFALAYAGICDVWLGRQQFGFVSPIEAIPKAKEAALKAVELDNTRAEVHYTLAVMYVWGMWDWDKGEKEFKKTLQINPNHAQAHEYYSHLLAILGRNEEAYKQGEIAMSLDPQNALIKVLHAGVLYMDHKYDEAVKLLKDALLIEPNYAFAQGNLGNVYEFMGKNKEAIEQYKLSDASDTELVNTEVKGYIEGGINGLNLSVVKLFEMRFKNSYVRPTLIAYPYALLGEKDKAIYWLEQAYQLHDPQLPYLRHPAQDKLRDDPRFQEIARKMKLPYK